MTTHAEIAAKARAPYASRIMELEVDKAELVAGLKTAVYLLGEIHAGNAYSEPLLWVHVRRLRATLDNMNQGRQF